MAVDRDKDVLGGDLPPGRRICPRQRVPGDHLLDFVVVVVFLVIPFVVVVVAVDNKSTDNPFVVVVTLVVYYLCLLD